MFECGNVDGDCQLNTMQAPEDWVREGYCQACLIVGNKVLTGSKIPHLGQIRVSLLFLSTS